MNDETTWAPRFGDLPRVSHTLPIDTPPRQTSDKGATPTVSEFEFDGETHRSLSWKTKDGTTSASPASRHFANRAEASSTEDLLRDLYAGLAKPGTPSDYHFAIQHAIDELWKRRRDDPQAVTVIEPLCLADIGLVEAYPDAFRSGDRYYSVLSMDLLIELYENAGDLDAAVALAQRVAPFVNGTGDLERLEEKRGRLTDEES